MFPNLGWKQYRLFSFPQFAEGAFYIIMLFLQVIGYSTAETPFSLYTDPEIFQVK